VVRAEGLSDGLFLHRAANVDHVVGDNAKPGSRPWRRLTTLMRPSHPVRHFWPLRNQRFFCSCFRSGLFVERLGMQTRLTPIAQVRLCGRYRRLSAAGKLTPVIAAAIAREMAAFLWAIGRRVAPAGAGSDHVVTAGP
jgi:hypothetical protein